MSNLKYYLLLCLLLSRGNSFAQLMQINDPPPQIISYGIYGKQITSTKELPSIIRRNLDAYLLSIMGDQRDSLTFSYGSIVDLKKIFSADTTTSRFNVVPAYRLQYQFKYRQMGFVNYNLVFHLDEYGQILFCNWPRRKYNKKKYFIDTETIRSFALNAAKEKGWSIDAYTVNGLFVYKVDKFCWHFKFPIKDVPVTAEKNSMPYNELYIPWDKLEILNTYEDLASPHYY